MRDTFRAKAIKTHHQRKQTRVRMETMAQMNCLVHFLVHLDLSSSLVLSYLWGSTDDELLLP